jgi:hypothetical protein
MNLNENRRLENFEISDDKDMADYLAGIVDECFTEQVPAEWNEAYITEIGNRYRAKAAKAAEAKAPKTSAPKQPAGNLRLSVDWEADITL